MILPVALLEVRTDTLLTIRSQRPPHPTDGEELSASKKDAPLDLKKDGIDMAGTSKRLALNSSASHTAGHDSLQHLIDDQITGCPYHAYILQEPLSYRARETSASAMERFMIHHPGEQYALFIRPDNKKLSTHRECLCQFMSGDNFSFTETQHKSAGEETGLPGFQVGL